MTRNQNYQFNRFLNEFADARADYNMAGSAGDVYEQIEARKEASKRMIVAKKKLVQMFNSMEKK